MDKLKEAARMNNCSSSNNGVRRIIGFLISDIRSKWNSS